MREWLVKHGVPWYVFCPEVFFIKTNGSFLSNLWVITGWGWVAKLCKRMIK